MAITALERGLQLCGLRFLFAPIPRLLAYGGPRDLPARKKRAANDLVRYLDTAITGVQLYIRRQSGKRHLAQPFTKTIPAERAYGELRLTLPREPSQALVLLRDLKRISLGLRDNRSVLNRADRGRLRSFCRKALSHLDRESFENTQRLALWFP